MTELVAYNEACATCGKPRDLHKGPNDAPSGSLHSTWGDVDTCRTFVRCSPPRAAYGTLMSSTESWTTKAAAQIVGEMRVISPDNSVFALGPTKERIASIIATHAESRIKELEALLRESKRTHDRGYNEESCDYPPCPKSNDDDNGGPGELEHKCTCSADAWNAKVDEALRGIK
jgi:hypothetical protein